MKNKAFPNEQFKTQDEVFKYMDKKKVYDMKEVYRMKKEEDKNNLLIEKEISKSIRKDNR